MFVASVDDFDHDTRASSVRRRDGIPDFAHEIKTTCERWQLAECLETARQIKPFEPDIYDDEDADVMEMERQNDLRRSAADLLLVERAREWLLED